MNVLNRIVSVVLLLVVMVACTTLFLAPVYVFNWSGTWSGYFSRYFSRAIPYSAGWIGQKALGILFAVALDIILILVLILEVRWPKPKTIRVEKTSGGEVMISVASVADRLTYEIDQLAGVLRVKPKISVKRRGVVVVLDVRTVAGIDVPERSERIVATAQAVIEENLGLKLAQPPKVSLRTAPYPRTPVVRDSRRRPPSVVKEEPPPIVPDPAPVDEPGTELLA